MSAAYDPKSSTSFIVTYIGCKELDNQSLPADQVSTEVRNLVEILNEKQKALEDKMADLNRHALFLPLGMKIN